MLQASSQLRGPVAGGSGGLHQLTEQLLRLGEAAEDQVHLGETLGQDGPPRVIQGKQGSGSGHEVLRRSLVEAGQRTLGGVPEPLAGSNGQRRSSGTFHCARPLVLDGLLEVVADELVELGRRVRALGLEPVPEPLVQVGAVLAGHALVGGQLDQRVQEPEGPWLTCASSCLRSSSSK